MRLREVLLNKQKTNKGILSIGLAPICVGAILFCVFYINGVYPFGTVSIAYYDMPQSFIPLYFHTWDMLHGSKSLFFDWNVAMGCSLADVAGAFELFPTNLFFLFIEREDILGSMSFFLIIKMMLAAFAMSFYAFKRYRDRYLTIYAGLAYAFCGYVLQYYTNIHFLDDVIVFPLLIWAMKRLITTNKKTSYIILLSLVFLTNQQLAFMVVIYIFFKGWFEIQKLEEDRKGRAISSLVLSSLVGFLLSSVSFIPSFLQMLQSSRFNNAMSVSLKDVYMTIELERFFELKPFMLYGCEIGLGGAVFVLINRNRVKSSFDRICMVIILALPILFENIDLLWHGGAYQDFPMRFGYMLSFELISLICFILTNEAKEDTADSNESLLLICLILMCVSIFMIFVVCRRFRQYGIVDEKAYHGYGFIIVVLVVLGIILFYVKSKKIIRVLLITLALIQGSLGAYGLIAPYGNIKLESSLFMIDNCEVIRENVDLLDSTNRVKDINQILGTNYGFILGQSSLGGWMNGINPHLQDTMVRMGYSANYTRVLDSGGTVLTDTLLGVCRGVSNENGVPCINCEEKSTDAGSVYKNDYSFPFGMLMTQSTIAGVETEGYSQLFEYQNELFSSFTEIDEELITEIPITSIASKDIYDATEGINIYDMNIEINSRSVIYAYAERDANIIGRYAFVVDGEQLQFNSLGAKDNVMYADYFYNGFSNLGSYADQMVNIVVLSTFDNLEKLHIGALNLELFEKGIQNVNEKIVSQARIEDNRLIMNIFCDKGGTLFLPVSYYGSYRLMVDGYSQDYFPVVNDTFVGLSIEQGTHEIELSYLPSGFEAGVVLSALGVVLLALLAFKKTDSTDEQVLFDRCWIVAYNLFFLVMLIVLYIIPIVAFCCKVIAIMVLV